MSRPLYFSDPSSLEHDPREFSPGHPDTPERLVVLERALAERDWFGWERRQAPAATEAQLELVHTRSHVVAIRELCEAGGGAIDPDTFVGRRSFLAALHAAGGAREMARALIAGEAAIGFCCARPSGHHAESGRAMGFCLFNNVAVAAAAGIAEFGLERVLVIDWDVHHGNGTEEIFALRSDVLFASLHQSPLYPGSGRLQDAGRGPGEGYTINLPVPPQTGESEWMELFDRVVMPAARAFEPQLLLVSAGFDAHAADPLAECRLRTETFAIMAERLRDFTRARGIPLGVMLEGGYNREVLAEAVCAVMPVLAGEADAPPALPRPPGTGPLSERAIAQVGRWWPLS